MKNLAVVEVLQHPLWPGVPHDKPSMTVDSDNNHVYCSAGTTLTAFNIITGDVSTIDSHLKITDISTLLYNRVVYYFLFSSQK